MATEIDDRAMKLAQRVWSLMEEARAVAARGAGLRRQAFAQNRVIRAASKAESALLRISCPDPGDLGSRIGYGEIVRLRSTLLTRDIRTARGYAIIAARSALWALYGAELVGGDVPTMRRLTSEPPIRSEYVDPRTGPQIDGELRLAMAAEARFLLAELLARVNRPQPKNPITPQQLDATLRDRGKFSGGVESLLWNCQLASCREYSAGEEAHVLATEAAAIYRYLSSVGNGYGPDHLDQAQSRRAAVLELINR